MDIYVTLSRQSIEPNDGYAYDVARLCTLYAQQVEAAIQTAYPDALVHIETHPHILRSRVAVDAERLVEEDRVQQHVEDLMQQVWANTKWDRFFLVA